MVSSVKLFESRKRLNKNKEESQMPDFSAAITLLRKPIEDLYGVASLSVQSKLVAVRTAARAKALHTRLWETQKVKTIWNTDRPLSLNTFFYPVNVVGPRSVQGIGTRLTSLDDLPDNHNIIFGTVGQGKSILMRYLLGREIKSGTRIPVFCELRNIGTTQLLEYLCARFCLLLGMQTDIEVFKSFAQAGKLSFFLDGFDEIDPEKSSGLCSEIDDLSYAYSTCRIVLSSRPDSECRHLTNFVTNRICPLGTSDLLPFYKKVTKDDDLSKRLVAAVGTSPTKIRELVSTPLLATLLAISYRAAHKIPLDFAEFYDELFQILLVRHDSSKLGWRRQRKSKLNDREIQQAFEAFCFATRRKRSVPLDRDNASDIADEALKECGIVTRDPAAFLDDIKKITCLLVDEGQRSHFVHVSVQEFFAARYIRKRAEPVAMRFYAQLLVGDKWRAWNEELQFLTQIDRHRAMKFFVLPDMDSTIADLLGTELAVSRDTIDRYLSSIVVVRRQVQRDGANNEQFHVKVLRHAKSFHYDPIDSRAFRQLFQSAVMGESGWQIGFQLNPGCERRSYLEITRDIGNACYSRVAEAVTIGINALIRERIGAKHEVEREEAESAFIQL
jgi:hypothetical protein